LFSSVLQVTTGSLDSHGLEVASTSLLSSAKLSIGIGASIVSVSTDDTEISETLWFREYGL